METRRDLSLERDTALDQRDWYESQPSPAQRDNLDNSETQGKELYAPERQLVMVTEENVDEIFDNLNETDSKIEELQSMFHRFGRDEFILRLISSYSADEIQLESLRGLVYTEVRSLQEFPYTSSTEMKRRIKRRNGDSVAYKVASDIYTLVNVMDGGPFEDLKEMLALPKHSARPEYNSSMCSSQTNASNIHVLSSTVTQLQADVLKLKQENSNLSEQLSCEMKAIKASITSVKAETNSLFNRLESLISGNTDYIDRVADDRSSGVAKLKSDMKLVRDEVTSHREDIERRLSESHEKVASQTRSVDKRLGKMEQQIKQSKGICQTPRKLLIVTSL